ncbi:PEP-utilizing enzyme [Actinocrispum wychmicini]|uniref:PEP-utilizing family enzyme n=1 Tax=Actinocrispum wychmicini TaxID=1213861 RepID=A0A4R2JR18_9PSEU|nr:PEP-utilizing enzyme [Actinocrispum wychmicini]TCO61914.1 PEP-utilizing family enzyme [Actinocrispum wychmicini]
MRPVAKGIAASGGQARGRACVMRDKLRPVEPGEVLVTVLTDPVSFADLVEHAVALVTDLGGLTSHPAILARELGIPAVVSTRDGTSTIQDGALIMVDGDTGEVFAVD